MNAAELFTAGDDVTWRLRPIRRGGHDFLLLPPRGRAAATGLSLYPAQTTKARALRSACSLLLRCGFPRATATIRIAKDDPLLRLIGQFGGVDEPAILAGNPNAAGRRFALLPFDRDGRPTCVIKAGRGAAAVARIERERQFLESAPRDLGIPKPLGALTGGDVRALATEFIPGRSPGENSDHLLGPTLARWIDTSRSVRVADIPAWRRLQASGELRSASTFAETSLHPALVHGDFAPWNVRIGTDGRMHAFDWEDGELDGIPGFDWIQYVARRAVLVQRRHPARIADEIAALVAGRQFCGYLENAGAGELGPAIALASIQHIVSVSCPAEGLEHFAALLHSLTNRWPNA